ncbi:hypothetical protein ACFW04_011606 [Cataglyphis niger]
MSIEQDILAEINELLGKAEPAYGPETLEARPIDRPPPAPRPPKVGTIIQRSDRKNRIKAAMLATPPPPLASWPPAPKLSAATSPATKADTDKGPKTGHHTRPLHVRNLGPHGPHTATADHGGSRAGKCGTDAPVPHFAVHVSRRYKIRLPQGRWTLRFSADGKL